MSSSDAFVYGFRAFGQVDPDQFVSILHQLKIPTSTSVKYITSSWSRCYIILDDGTVYLFGLIDSSLNSKKRICPPFKEKPKKVLCLVNYDWFVTEDGFCWKYLKNGLWSGPISLTEFKDLKIIDIASAEENSEFILFSSGCLLNYSEMKISIPFKVKKICCGYEHNVCLLENGSIYIWGNGSRGQLGNNSLATSENPELLVYLDGLFIKDIDSGGWHNAALTNSGDLYTWGWNNFGQLGFRTDLNVKLGDDTSYVSVLPEPGLVEWPNDLTVTVEQISCGTSHTIVLCDDGVVWGCGNNKYGQINPMLKTTCLDHMTRLPIPDSVSIVNAISCSSWNTVMYVLLKDTKRGEYHFLSDSNYIVSAF